MAANSTPWAGELSRFWFGSLSDATKLDPQTEPFSTHMQRWYGKDRTIDAEVRARFEPIFSSLTASADAWMSAVAAAGDDARAQLALIILVDQLPRHMYRDTPQMYAHDGLALAHAYRCLPALLRSELSLLERMFAIVPLMHAEDLTIQLVMERSFVELTRDAERLSPHNREFYEFALGYARRHREVIARFGRFPHRNTILERRSTPEEERALREEALAF